jgi:hypothetical protein
MNPESRPTAGSGSNTPETRSRAAFARRRGNPAILAAAAICGLAGCASTTRDLPPPGHALIDATPDHDRRDRIDGIHLVAVNGTPTHGTQTALKPGRNTVRVGFHWPQGGNQEVDLVFHAVEGSIYLVYYDVFPPYANRMGEPTGLEQRAGEVAGLSQGSGEALLLVGPPALALWGAGFMKRGANEFAEHQKPAQYIDLMVVCRHGPEGIVRRVRAYPDGRVDAAPWAAQAQMKDPR